MAYNKEEILSQCLKAIEQEECTTFEEMCLYAARLDGGVSVEAVRGLTVERSGGRMSFKSANAYWSLEQKSFR